MWQARGTEPGCLPLLCETSLWACAFPLPPVENISLGRWGKVFIPGETPLPTPLPAWPAPGPRTCSRGSAAGAATLGARPERPVARRAEAAGGRGLEPGRRGAQAARGPELGGARPGRRRLRLEVRGGRGC